jgi:small ligand-binding sensory domain FIST
METPLPARVMVSGRLVSVDTRGGTIDVFRDQKVLKLELDRDALVTQAGKTMALADLQPGQSVVVQLQLVGRTARANWVAAKPMAAPSEAALAETAPAPPPAPPPALAAAQGPATR